MLQRYYALNGVESIKQKNLINMIIGLYKQKKDESVINHTQRKKEDVPFNRPTTPSMSVSYIQQLQNQAQHTQEVTRNFQRPLSTSA